MTRHIDITQQRQIAKVKIMDLTKRLETVKQPGRIKRYQNEIRETKMLLSDLDDLQKITQIRNEMSSLQLADAIDEDRPSHEVFFASQERERQRQEIDQDLQTFRQQYEQKQQFFK